MITLLITIPAFVGNLGITAATANTLGPLPTAVSAVMAAISACL